MDTHSKVTFFESGNEQIDMEYNKLMDLKVKCIDLEAYM